MLNAGPSHMREEKRKKESPHPKNDALGERGERNLHGIFTQTHHAPRTGRKASWLQD